MSGPTEVPNDTAAYGRVKFLFAIQALSGLFYLGCGAFLLYLTTTPQVRHGYDPAGAAYGLRIAAFVCGIHSAFTLISALGLRKNKLWGFRLGAGVAWLMIAALSFGMWDDKTVDWEMLWIMLPYLGLAIFFLLPGTRMQIRALQH